MAHFRAYSRPASLLLFVCAVTLASAAVLDVRLQKRTVYAFPQDGVYISNKFPGARVSSCERIGTDKYRILITAENQPINRSAWYAFEVRSDISKQIEVTLNYVGGIHRYKPMLSKDGVSWKRLAGSAVTLAKYRTRATLKLAVNLHPLRIAGQEQIGNGEFDVWMEEMAASPFITRSTIGKSRGGRALDALVLGNPSATNSIAIISRQHPPEVTGTLGMFAFLDVLKGDSPLARKFRERFTTLIIPSVNPDGIHEGHWRHSLAGVDLNRDWDNFHQPETRATRDRILALTTNLNARVFLFLDFHSTHRDIFYTGTPAQKTFPRQFTSRWLDALRNRFPDYKVNVAANASTRAVSKAWAWKTLGCPAVTYEFGDHTDRALIAKITRGSAEEVMRLLLAAPASPPLTHEPNR